MVSIDLIFSRLTFSASYTDRFCCWSNGWIEKSMFSFRIINFPLCVLVLPQDFWWQSLSADPFQARAECCHYCFHGNKLRLQKCDFYIHFLSQMLSQESFCNCSYVYTAEVYVGFFLQFYLPAVTMKTILDPVSYALSFNLFESFSKTTNKNNAVFQC